MGLEWEEIMTTGPKTITAHLLDPVHGYSKQAWVVGQEISEEGSKRAEDGCMYLVIAYSDGEAQFLGCSKSTWQKQYAEFTAIDKAHENSPSLRLIDRFKNRWLK